MNNINKLFLVVVLGFTLISGCKKISDGLAIGLNSSISKNYVVLQFKDASNSNIIPSGLNVQIVGPDADYIYNEGGKKVFTVGSNGVLGLQVSPERIVTKSNPVIFYVQVSSNNYLPITKSVVVNAGKLVTQSTFNLANISKPAPGVNVSQVTFNLVNGAIPQTSKLSTLGVADTAYYDDGNTTVLLPIGTTFSYYAWVPDGHIITIPSRTDSSVNWVTDSTQTIGNTTTTYRHKQTTYYQIQAYSYQEMQWKLVKYKGSSVKCVLQTRKAHSIDYSLFPYDNPDPIQTFNLLNGESSREDELLFENAVQQYVVGLNFIGDNGREILPDSTAAWFTSFVLNPNVKNRLTGNPIKEGDSIEVGLDYNTGLSMKSIISKTPGGQLRAACQSPSAGYYYHAPYSISFYNSYNTNIDSTRTLDHYNTNYNPITGTSVQTPVYLITAPMIPDPENLTASAYLNLGPTGYYYSFNPNEGYRSYSGKISANTPVSNTSSVNVYYGNQRIKTNVNTTDVFNPPYSVTLPPKVHYFFTLTCPNDNKTANLTWNNGYWLSNHGWLRFNINNGDWNSRLFNQGESFYLEGTSGDDLIKTTIIVNSEYVPINIISNGKDFCKGF